jgi:hypothetical protein
MSHAPNRHRRFPHTSLLAAGGWRPDVRSRLDRLIREGRGRGFAVALDFDNTLTCGDIGEATLAMLVRQGRLSPERLPPALSPGFRTPAGPRVNPHSPPDLTTYYEALLAPTVHGPADPTPLASGYVWAVEAMSNLRVGDILQATEEAYRRSGADSVGSIEVTPGRPAYPAPYFYPEMVDLLAALLRHGFSLWILSASNIWSVRWMVQEALNPMLRERGAPRGIPPGQIVGVSVLLQDRRGRLHKDTCLVRENPRYACLDAATLRQFRLTRWLQFPVPTYSGKVGCLWDVLQRPPELAVGDSPGDHAMLAFAQRRLWIARLDKPDYQAATANLMRRTGSAAWMVQPVLTQGRPAFVADPDQMPPLPPKVHAKVRRSLSHFTTD